MTDLEAYVEAPGRAELVEEVRRQIDAVGISYIYYQFISVTGRVVGKGIPADHWERTAERGFQLVYGATANLFTDRHRNYIGYGPEASELIGIPDPETFVQLPWDKRVGRVFCTCFRNREEDENPGAFLTSDCRGNLRRFHDGVRGEARHASAHGHRARDDVAEEGCGRTAGRRLLQAVLLPHRPVREPAPGVHAGDRLRPRMGLDMIQGDHEDAPGQLELNFTFDDALRNCDRLTTYRQICAQVAREHGLIACFMSKPFMGVSASGCHANISLWSGGEDQVNPLGQDPLPGLEGSWTYVTGGDNHFMPDDAVHPKKPGPIGLNCIGGVIEHLPALTALGCSTVNSYRRLWDQGFWAPVYADWGYQNRTCGLRVSAPGRFEYRAVDSMMNPYLLASGLLMAFDDGLERKLDPGEPESRNIYAALAAGKEVDKLPLTLGDALHRLEHDEVIRQALPDEMYRVFMHYKRDEWEKFLATVTEWDVRTYLDCLP